MKLNLPEQTAPSSDAIPNNPRKLKKVIYALPNTNMGELTRQTYQILRSLNRQPMPNRDRLENLEMLRVLAREIFNNLKKYFINRTLPLPEKSQKIVNLNQSILRELIIGYEIIAYEAANNIDPGIDDKTLSIAICRAINYLSEILLRSSEVYATCPKFLWYEVHQLYLLAENRNISTAPVINNENRQPQVTIESSYKQILLFALARPIALRQRDSERVYLELFDWSKYSSILKPTSAEQIDTVFCMKMDRDLAPNYLTQSDLDENNTLRILDAKQLVLHIKGIIEERSKQKQQIAVGETIPLETLTMLISSWGISAKRRFARAGREEHINVAIGLARVASAIHDSYQPKEDYDVSSGFVRSSFSSPKDPEFTLEVIPTKEENSSLKGYITHSEVASKESNAWDMVAKGRTLTEAYDKQQQKLTDQKMKLRQQNADSYWQIVNISAGGYCLRWNSDDTSKAQIGELIALQEFDTKGHFEWRIGVIRWMQFTQEYGLEIGVQVLSPKVITAKAQRFNRPQETPFDCLMLPGITALKQPSSTILPSHAFSSGDKLVVQILEKKVNITLGMTKEHTGSFTQFIYKHTEEEQRLKKQEEKEETSKNRDDFDEIWSSL